jgi:hypothetical protein
LGGVGGVDSNVISQEANTAGLEGGLDSELLASAKLKGHGRQTRDGEVLSRLELDTGDADIDDGLAGNRLLSADRLDINGIEIVGGCAVQRRLGGSTIAVEETLVGAQVHDAVTEDRTSELADSRNGPGLE